MTRFNQANPLRLAGPSFIDSANFPTRANTVTKPVTSTTGIVVPLADVAGELTPEQMKLLFVAVGSDNDVYSCRVYGWHQVIATVPSAILWVYVILGEFVCTFSGSVGVANSVLAATVRFADTVVPVAARNEDRVIGAGTAVNSDTKVNSPVGDLNAHVVLPVRGVELVEFVFDQTTGTPTGNVLYSLLP